MRFYLDLPLAVGYSLMATAACLGMLQYAAARGGYRGLSLFVSSRIVGRRFGLALIIASLAAYLALAPDILTPGPAGTEVAAMFALCALAALVLTLLGADWRIRRKNGWTRSYSPITSSNGLSGRVCYPPPPPTQSLAKKNEKPFLVIVIPDPAEFVTTPESVITAFTSAGIGVLVAPIQHPSNCGVSSIHPLHSQQISGILAELVEWQDIQSSSVGVLGMGMAGDIALRVAALESVTTATVAVTPLVPACHLRRGRIVGLSWLHELSYHQAWKWRRCVSALLRFGQHDHNYGGLRPRILTQVSSRFMTTRRGARAISELEVPSDRYFTILEDEDALQRVVDWFQTQFR